MNLDSDLFTRRIIQAIEQIVSKYLKLYPSPMNQVATVTNVYGVYPNQTADVILPTGNVSIPNIQNASIHSLSIGDVVYVEMMYGNMNCSFIKVKKI